MNQNTSTIISNSYDKPTPPIIKKHSDNVPSEPSKNSDSNNKEIVDLPDTVIEGHAKIPFWTEDPNVLFQPQYLLEFFPVNSMTYEQKLNAISRLIFVLTIISFMLTQNLRLLLIGAITLTAIFVVFFYHQKEKDKKDSKKVIDTKKEGFSGPALAYYVDNNLPIPSGVFTRPDSSNPFSNVLMTDYDYNPNKKPAPPAFNPEINSQIVEQTKQMVSDSNPDQPDITDRLYKDLGEQLMFEQSLRPFNSNPATTIPNDQGAFADFCYGSMISCKEGNKFACARNMSHYTNY